MPARPNHQHQPSPPRRPPARLAAPAPTLAARGAGLAALWTLLLLLVVAPVAGAATGGHGNGLVPGRITAIGDSVLLDAAPDLDTDLPGVEVQAAVGRQWDEGVALARRLRAEHQLGATVVVDLGTNGPVSPGQFEAMMTALAGVRVVVFVNVHLPSSYSWWQSVNATLAAGVRRYPEARLADFEALADSHPSWFGADGVHMPVGGPGAQALARLVADTVRRGAASGQAS